MHGRPDPTAQQPAANNRAETTAVIGQLISLKKKKKNYYLYLYHFLKLF